MSASLHLCSQEDMAPLALLVSTYHEHIGLDQTKDQTRDALLPLLQGIPQGVAYLIGPRKSPVGYIIFSFGYSLKFGGIDGVIDEFFIRSNIRGRGMGGEVLASLLPALSSHGVKALHLEVEKNNRAEKLFSRAGFRLRDGYHLMTREL